MLLAAAVWDSEDAAVWTQTAAGLTVAGGAALFIGRGGFVYRNLLTAAGLLGWRFCGSACAGAALAPLCIA